jgi:hypothetical protein
MGKSKSSHMVKYCHGITKYCHGITKYYHGIIMIWPFAKCPKVLKSILKTLILHIGIETDPNIWYSITNTHHAIISVLY